MVEFAVFLLGVKGFNELTIHCGRVFVINAEMIVGGHTVQVQQTILFTMVAIPHTICIGS